MDQGPLPQARRGELRLALSIGDVWDGAGAVSCDPEEQGHHGVCLIFRQCDALGTLHALWRDLVHQGSDLGVRRRAGSAKGTLEWRRPTRLPLHHLLQKPL